VAEAAPAAPAGPVATAVNPVSRVNPVSPVNPAAVPAGPVATAVKPASLVDNPPIEAAHMTPDPSWNIEIPRIGRHAAAQRGPASDAYQAAGEAYQSVMVLLAKLIGFLVMMPAGLALIVAIGYLLGGYVGALIPVAIAATILILVFRSDTAVACRSGPARGPGRGTPDCDVIDARRFAVPRSDTGSIQNGSPRLITSPGHGACDHKKGGQVRARGSAPASRVARGICHCSPFQS